MLGALVVFLQFLLYGLCWNLNKKMKDLKDAGNSISMGLFVGCSIVNFIVLVPILTIILWAILLGIFGFKGPVGEDWIVGSSGNTGSNNNLMCYSISILQVQVVYLIVSENYKYKKQRLYPREEYEKD